jgi:hypothetical protein
MIKVRRVGPSTSMVAAATMMRRNARPTEMMPRFCQRPEGGAGLLEGCSETY